MGVPGAMKGFRRASVGHWQSGHLQKELRKASGLDDKISHHVGPLIWFGLSVISNPADPSLKWILLAKEWFKNRPQCYLWCPWEFVWGLCTGRTKWLLTLSHWDKYMFLRWEHQAEARHVPESRCSPDSIYGVSLCLSAVSWPNIQPWLSGTGFEGKREVNSVSPSDFLPGRGSLSPVHPGHLKAAQDPPACLLVGDNGRSGLSNPPIAALAVESHSQQLLGREQSSVKCCRHLLDIVPKAHTLFVCSQVPTQPLSQLPASSCIHLTSSCKVACREHSAVWYLTNTPSMSLQHWERRKRLVRVTQWSLCLLQVHPAEDNCLFPTQKADLEQQLLQQPGRSLMQHALLSRGPSHKGTQ